MRMTVAIMLSLALVACGAAPDADSPTAAAVERADPVNGKSASADFVPVLFKAKDGVTVYGRLYAAPRPKAVILLFHQAGSGKGEYAMIAPRLAKLGYTALAIDQRSGGSLFGVNQTAAGIKGDPSFLDAKADLQAALDWASPQGHRVILWGSSYSSALVFLTAAENRGKVAAVMAFSPGEYLGRPTLVRDAAAKLDVPVYITSAKDAGEIAVARMIAQAVPGGRATQFVPQIGGVHGSSTLIDARDAKGSAENWAAVERFLMQVAP